MRTTTPYAGRMGDGTRPPGSAGLRTSPTGRESSRPIPWVFGEMARKITPGEILRIIVNDAAHEAKARRVLVRAGVDMQRVEFFRFPTNRGWTRDMGPMFVCATRRLDVCPPLPVLGVGEISRLEKG